MPLRKIRWGLLLTLVLGGHGLASANKALEHSFFLRANASPENNPQYSKVKAYRKNPALLEKAKILYLLGQIQQSPFLFERNGTTYTGPKAAAHLRMKYGYAKNRISTAEQFIHFIAAGSLTTGKPYYIIDEQGTKHPSLDVLENELALLEENLEDGQSIQTNPKT